MLNLMMSQMTSLLGSIVCGGVSGRQSRRHFGHLDTRSFNIIYFTVVWHSEYQHSQLTSSVCRCLVDLHVCEVHNFPLIGSGQPWSNELSEITRARHCLKGGRTAADKMSTYRRVRLIRTQLYCMFLFE